MAHADWGVFKDGLREFKRKSSGWVIAFIIYCVVTAGLIGASLFSMSALGIWSAENSTWLQDFVRISILNMILYTTTSWLYGTFHVTIWPEDDRSPINESLRLLPHFFVIGACIATVSTTAVQMLDPAKNYVFNVALSFLIVLFLPLVVHKKISTYRAVTQAPLLLLKNPGHALLLVIAQVIGIGGILLLGVGLLFTVPLCYILTLLILNQLSPTQLERASQIENSASKGV